jgi:hypothetical protein
VAVLPPPGLNPRAQVRGIFERAAVAIAANVKLHGARPWHLRVARLNSQRPSKLD